MRTSFFSVSSNFSIPSAPSLRSAGRLFVFFLLFQGLLPHSGSLAQSLPPSTGGKNIAGKDVGTPTRYSMQELTTQSELVVHGRVAALKSGWNEGKTRIYTVVTITVDDVWKGERPGATLEVRYPGGEVGDVGELYSHLPTFRKDEEIVVFTKRSADGIRRVVGGLQGKMIVTTDEAGVRKIGSGDVTLGEMKRAVNSVGVDR